MGCQTLHKGHWFLTSPDPREERGASSGKGAVQRIAGQCCKLEESAILLSRRKARTLSRNQAESCPPTSRFRTSLPSVDVTHSRARLMLPKGF
jgi:hypothetical protein